MCKVLGIDGSLSSTGWAIIDIETKEILKVGRIQTKSKLDELTRILNITKELIEICKANNVSEVVVEDQFISVNRKTALQLARLRGGLSVGLMLANIQVSSSTVAHVRYRLVGEGDADKIDVANKIREMYEDSSIIQTLGEFNDKNNKHKNSDIYDAIALGLVYIYDKYQETEEYKSA